MEGPRHDMSHLFAQLGLPAEPGAIEHFIASHHPLPAAVPLAEAPFWNPAQAAFLQEEILVDADWAEVIDELNMDLRALD
jgi:hypothetical protein